MPTPAENTAQYLERAQRELLRILDGVDLNFVALDGDWRGGPRLVYGGPCVEACEAQCDSCPLYRTVREDPPQAIMVPDLLRRSLAPASDHDRELFGGPQRFVNCRTWARYTQGFISWFVSECQTETDIDEEFACVVGFRLLMLRNLKGGDLLEAEADGKHFIVQNAVDLMRRQGNPLADHLEQRAREAGLLD